MVLKRLGSTPVFVKGGDYTRNGRDRQFQADTPEQARVARPSWLETAGK